MQYYKRKSLKYTHRGNLLSKDLSDVVQEKHVIETEYLETLFVAVPK